MSLSYISRPKARYPVDKAAPVVHKMLSEVSSRTRPRFVTTKMIAVLEVSIV